MPATDPKPPSKIGKYTLADALGRGAYGDVYVGVAKGGPKVAVKLLDPGAARDADVVARFEREAETAQRLDHPNIVQVLDVGAARGRHYLVMELVHGGSLRRLLDRGGAPHRVLPILAEVAQALAFAHEKGVIHRDVKPENVLLTRSYRAKVADFGLARAIEQTSMTTAGKVIGTAVYMSPEQARGHRASGFSDVYALGVMIYEAITGELPFKADSQLGFMYQHAEVEPPRPRLRAPYPSALASLALDCLAKEPTARPTMAQVAERLSAAALVRPRRLVRWALAVAAALVVLAIVVPQVVDPLCGRWFGAPPFRALRHGARVAHDAVFGHL